MVIRSYDPCAGERSDGVESFRFVTETRSRCNECLRPSERNEDALKHPGAPMLAIVEDGAFDLAECGAEAGRTALFIILFVFLRGR